MRGKCRYCDDSVSAERYGWASEQISYYPYECVLAPLVECPPCSGTGKVMGPSRHGQEPEFEECPNCSGLGEVPGPHWPWRHPHPMAMA